ncbi:MAG: hypothetical protein ACTSU5_10770 [Promethearchaeota archaeon]
MSSFWNQKVAERILRGRSDMALVSAPTDETSVELKVSRAGGGKLELVLRGSETGMRGYVLYDPGEDPRA